MRLVRNPFVLVSLSAVAAVVVVSCSIPISPVDSGGGAIVPVAASSETQPVHPGGDILPATDPPGRILNSSWSTDFGRRTVEWEDIMSGGPPKDGIPAIDDPATESIEDASQWLTDRDPVILVQRNGEVRAYPLAILIWHEIVNDVVGGQPVAVTFCPLCNASIVFDRSFEGEVLDFGTTGLLRNSDLVMYDRQSETWWQQFTGTGIVGNHAGEQLAFLPSQVVSFEVFRTEFPEGLVLARPPAARSYGVNPYTSYDSTAGRPFLYSGELDSRLPATERVVGVELGGTIMAYPFSALAAEQVVNDEVGGVPVAVFHKGGTASALDTRTINEGKDVGSAAVYKREVDGRILTFEPVANGSFRDIETGSSWNILGTAVEGELEGKELDPVLAFDHFWFAWTAFFPETGLYGD